MRNKVIPPVEWMEYVPIQSTQNIPFLSLLMGTALLVFCLEMTNICPDWRMNVAFGAGARAPSR
jgi:hypothetical protein